MEPHGIERDIIAMIINHPRICESRDGSLLPSDFHDSRHRRIFETAMSLCSLSDTSPLDFFMLLEHMTAEGVLSDCGGLGYLFELASSVPPHAVDTVPGLIAMLRTHGPQESSAPIF